VVEAEAVTLTLIMQPVVQQVQVVEVVVDNKLVRLEVEIIIQHLQLLDNLERSTLVVEVVAEDQTVVAVLEQEVVDQG
jgi:hypothetical protein